MKKLAAIPILVLLLFSGIRINIASHFCGGRLVQTKISLSGEIASCGMEGHSPVRIPNGSITGHCCDDVISSFSAGNNYVPSLCVFLPDNRPELNHFYIIPGDLYKSQEINISPLAGIKWPPGGFSPNDVDQQTLCIFRI